MKFEIRNLKLVSSVVAVIYVGLFLWLFYKHFSPLGVWRVKLNAPDTETRLIKGPMPPSRVEVDDAQDSWRLKETPVYFEVSNPRKFDQAELEVEFHGDTPIIEAGVVKSQDPWIVERRVLYHQYLEELSWPRLGEDDLILWQREPKYSSVAEFLAQPPRASEVVTVDYDFKGIGGARIVPTPLQSYDISLRGPQDIYVWMQGEDLEVTFFIQDMNRHDGADAVKVTACCNPDGSVMSEVEISDDGQEWNSEKPSQLRKIVISSPRPEHGIYRISFKASDDIFIRRIETPQAYLVFKNQLYLGDEVGYNRAPMEPVTVWSNGQNFALRTPHPESVQTIEFGALAEVNILEHNKQYTIQMPRAISGDVVAISAPKGDVVLNSDGFFALSRDGFLLPEPISYVSDIDLDRLGINYVLTRYKFAKDRGHNFKMNSIKVSTFDISPRSPLQFFVSTPQGKANDFLLKEIQFKLQKPRLTLARIFGKIRELWAKSP